MQIQQVNWLTRARKAAGGKGPAQADLGEDLMQVLQVADISDWQYDSLGLVKNFVLSANVPAVAAQVSAIQMVNPTGSNTLAFIDTVELLTVAALTLTMQLNFDSAALALAANLPCIQDTRLVRAFPTGGLAVVQCTAGTSAASLGGSLASRFMTVAATPITYPRRVVLAPGFALTIETPVNQTLTANLLWKERSAESGEVPLGT